VPTPLIAVPAYHLGPGRVSGWEQGGPAVPNRYVKALRRAGLRPLLLTAPDPAPAPEILEPFDALLLIGGGDIEARRYGEPNHPAMYGLEPERDELELELTREALRAEMPVLAICRGFQLLNVALGGTLHQHLADLPGVIEHGAPQQGGSAFHDVRVAAGSRLAKAVGGEDVITDCASHHHQGVDRLGDDVEPVGWSSDGLVEAIETGGPGWVLGVQWHPEMTSEEDPVQQGLFEAFADVVRN
jgi:putative glutamine amidotransferase